MDQLTLGDILRLVKALKDEGMSLSEIYKLPIYIGNDDELNGIHCAWGQQLIDSESDNEDDMYYVEMINERRCNIKLEGKAFLIA